MKILSIFALIFLRANGQRPMGDNKGDFEGNFRATKGAVKEIRVFGVDSKLYNKTNFKFQSTIFPFSFSIERKYPKVDRGWGLAF